jgi:hypothetical protein
MISRWRKDGKYYDYVLPAQLTYTSRKNTLAHSISPSGYRGKDGSGPLTFNIPHGFHDATENELTEIRDLIPELPTKKLELLLSWVHDEPGFQYFPLEYGWGVRWLIAHLKGQAE